MNVTPGMKKYFMLATILAAAALIADVANAVQFGWSIGFIGSFVYGTIALASGVLMVVAVYFLVAYRGNRIAQMVAYGTIAIWPAVFALNVWSQIGVVSADRISDVQHASIQDQRRGDVVKERDEAEARLKLFNKQLASLLEMQPWVATVSADGLREKLGTLDKAIAAEGSRKNGGCGRRCLDLMKEKTGVEEKIAAAEQRATLNGQIDATKKVLTDARAKLANTKAGDSKTRNASRLYAKLINFSLTAKTDDGMAEIANESTGIFTAIVLCLVAAALTMVSALPHLLEASGNRPHNLPENVHLATAQSQQQAPLAMPSQPQVVREIRTVERDNGADKLRRILAESLQASARNIATGQRRLASA